MCKISDIIIIYNESVLAKIDEILKGRIICKWLKNLYL